jgi:hypothetical protein
VSRKKKGYEPDGRVAIVVTRADCRAILGFVATGEAIPKATRRRLSEPLLTKTARHRASFRTGHQAALIFVADRHPDVLEAIRGGSTEILVEVVKTAADQFKVRDSRGMSGPLPAGDVPVQPLDPHRGPTAGRGARVLQGGAPGLGKRR